MSAIRLSCFVGAFTASRQTTLSTVRTSHQHVPRLGKQAHRGTASHSASKTNPEGINVAAATKALQTAQAVCFDVDSTVCVDEGIDVLAEFCGASHAVAELTRKAMGGSMLFQDALKARLDLMKPSIPIVEECLIKHPPKVSPGVAEFVRLLHDRGTVVYLVSGGFRLMINPVADELKIPRHRIFANTILFNIDGTYKGFDAKEPTSRDKGKAAVINSLKRQYKYNSVVMVGDGATDMQARPPADAFIGFGGVVVREPVQKGADWFVYDFKELIDAIKL